jgi:hypothetical protein
MKKMVYVVPCIVLLAAMAWGQGSKKTVSQVLDSAVKGPEGEFASAADAMPEDKYSFAPTNGEFKGVRTFAQQVKHVAAVNYLVGAAILGEKPPVELGSENGPDSLKSKAEIMAFLKDSFAYAHKAAASVDEKNMTDPIKSPFGEGQTTRLSMAMLIPAHAFDHYGQMVEYLRMNGIVPPASR